MSETVGETTRSAPPDGSDAGWEDPPRRSPATEAPMLAVDGFEGPLDWLLEMARARKLDLARLSILALIEAFVVAMQAALIPDLPVAGLARWADWTVMATQLTELRSRLLLPVKHPDAKAAQAQAETLRQGWISHAQMRAAADWLEQQPQLGRDLFVRGRPELGWAGQRAARRTGLSEETAAADDEEFSDEAGRDDLTALLRACLVALRLPLHAAAYQPRRLPFWSVADAMAQINKLLPAQSGPVSLDVFLPEEIIADAEQPTARRAAFAATLIAGLELARSGSLRLDQDGLWQPVRVA